MTKNRWRWLVAALVVAAAVGTWSSRRAEACAQRISDCLMARERERSMGNETADHERIEPHVDKALQRGEPEPSPPVAQDAHNTSHMERDTSHPAAVRSHERDTGPSR